MTQYISDLQRDIEATGAESIALRDWAEKVPEGWRTPNGTLFIPAPAGFSRDKQIMVLGIGYRTSAAFFRAAFHDPAVDIVAAILGPNIELFGAAQCLSTAPLGGHPKTLH